MRWQESVEGVDWEALAELYRRAPLSTKSPEVLRISFGNSRFVVFVQDDAGQLIGAGRAMADGADCSYLCDIAVAPELQGTGLGRKIVERLVELSAGHRKIILYAVAGKEAFYKKFGFRKMKTAMAIFTDPAEAEAKGMIEGE